MKFIICSFGVLNYTYLCEYEEVKTRYKYYFKVSTQGCEISSVYGRSLSSLREVSVIKIKKVIGFYGDGSYDLVTNKGKHIKHSSELMEPTITTDDVQKQSLRMYFSKKIESIIRNEFLRSFKVCHIYDELVFEADSYDDAYKLFKEKAPKISFKKKYYYDSYECEVSESDIFENIIGIDKCRELSVKGFAYTKANVLGDDLLLLELRSQYISQGTWDACYPTTSSKWVMSLAYQENIENKIELIEDYYDIINNNIRHIDGVELNYEINSTPENLAPIQLFEFLPFEITTPNKKLKENIFTKKNKDGSYKDFILDNAIYLIDKGTVNAGRSVPKTLRNERVKYYTLEGNEYKEGDE